MSYQYWKIILTPTHESPSLVWQTDNMSFGYIILGFHSREKAEIKMETF